MNRIVKAFWGAILPEAVKQTARDRIKDGMRVGAGHPTIKQIRQQAQDNRDRAKLHEMPYTLIEHMEDGDLVEVMVRVPGKTRDTLYKLFPGEVEELKEWMAEKAVR